MINVSNQNQYIDFVKEIKQKIHSAKSKAVLSVNKQMVTLYFEIGKEIVLKQESMGWGRSIVEEMSKDLQAEFGKRSGFSSQNLWYMRQFFIIYKETANLQQLVGEIPWGQNILIFSKCKDEKEREYYLKNTIEFGWSRNILTHHIKTDLYSRDNKELKQNNFTDTLPANIVDIADEMMKSEYAGKMNFYLNLLNDTVKMPHENPAIGIILCSDKDSLEVEYAILNTTQPLGVATYTIETELPVALKKLLPSSEEIKEVLDEK